MYPQTVYQVVYTAHRELMHILYKKNGLVANSIQPVSPFFYNGKKGIEATQRFEMNT